MPRRNRTATCHCTKKKSNRKQKTKHNDANNQLKTLQTRLIQMSFDTEAYIYQGVSISVDKARKYLQEVSFIKVQCAGDTRSLQVIEKLTLIMTRIIEDETRNNNQQSVPLQNLIEDNKVSTTDTTQDIQMAETNKAIELTETTDQENVHLTETARDVDENIDSEVIDLTKCQSIEHLDLNNHSVDQSQRYTKVTPDTSTVLTKAISNLSLNDVNQLDKVCLSNEVYSQSILDDLVMQIPDTSKQMKITTNLYHAENKKIAQKKIYEVDCSKNNIINKIPRINKSKQNKEKNEKQYSELNQKKDKIRKPRVYKRKNKINSKTKAKQTRFAKTAVNFDSSSLTCVKNGESDHANQANNINADNLKNVSSQKMNLQDLSWIKNINFIRVVDKDEYSTVEGIADTYWENVCFPSAIDENDYKF